MRNRSSSGGRDAAYLATMARLRARIAQSSENASEGLHSGSAYERDSDKGPNGFPGKSDSASRELRSGAEPDSCLEAITAGLNPQQLEAVTHSGAPLLVVAGAGSGKTRVLTSRIGYLIASGRATAGQILAITFTNKAAREMRERLESTLGAGAIRAMWVSTFHSACVRILRSEHAALGMRSTFTIYDAQDSQRLMKLVCREENIDVRAHPKVSPAESPT